MQYRETNVTFLVLEEVVEGLEEENDALCSLCIHTILSLQ